MAHEVELFTDFPVALDSLDHLYPHGTKGGILHSPGFVRKCEQVLGEKLAVLDLGCAGGGFIGDFADRGHLAVGLEGSDYCRKHGVGEWKGGSDYLFTCDVSKPFEVQRGGKRAEFDLIMCWELLEHLEEGSLLQFFENVWKHLARDGLFVGSVSTRPSRKCPNGAQYHVTIRPQGWWRAQFRRHGFRWIDDGPFEMADYPPGNITSDSRGKTYQAFIRNHTGNMGFTFVVQKVNR